MKILTMALFLTGALSVQAHNCPQSDSNCSRIVGLESTVAHLQEKLEHLSNHRGRNVQEDIRVLSEQVAHLHERLSQTESQVDHLREHRPNRHNSRGISCNWDGERYLSQGFNGDNAWNVGAWVNCNNGEISSFDYITNFNTPHNPSEFDGRTGLFYRR